jgi:hypothetical protein
MQRRGCVAGVLFFFVCFAVLTIRFAQTTDSASIANLDNLTSHFGLDKVRVCSERVVESQQCFLNCVVVLVVLIIIVCCECCVL